MTCLWWADLVHVDVVVVGGVVDRFEETLELTRGSAVDDQDEGDPHRRRRGGIRGLLVPRYVQVGLTCTEKTTRHTASLNKTLFNLCSEVIYLKV